MMKDSTMNILNDLFVRYQKLNPVKKCIYQCAEMLIEAYASGRKLLVCGNGGSAADALHIVGELMKGFALCRPLSDRMKKSIIDNCENAEYINENLQSTLPAIALVGSSALESAYANDKAPDLAFAQQVLGLALSGDVFLGISTSGNSKNVIYAAEVAKAMGLKVIAMTGRNGGCLKEKCDCLINVPEDETYKVQELHLPVYHTLCLALENEFFGE